MVQRMNVDGELVDLTPEEEAERAARIQKFEETTHLDYGPYRPSAGQDVGVTFQRAADRDTTVTLDVNGAPVDLQLDTEGIGSIVFTPDQEGQVVVTAPDGTSVTVEVQP